MRLLFFRLSLLVMFALPLVARAARAQEMLDDLNSNSVDVSVGVSRYHRPQPAHYRLLFGMGGNLGLMTDAPQTTVASAGYQKGESLFSASFLSSVSTWGVPRRNFDEFDVLYGLAFDDEIARYEARPSFFHFAVSAGLGFDTYKARWRRFRRGFLPDSTAASVPPNTFDYALNIPVQLQAMYEPLNFAGIGVMLFAGFNRISPNYGGALVLQARY